MSFEITTAFVEQYRSNVLNLVQQKGSRLRGSVMEESVNGKNAFVEQLGSTTAQLRTSRHADSPLVSTPHRRRRLSLADYEWGDLIDQPDKVRLLIDPTNPYAMNAGWAFGRTTDQIILDALDGNSFDGAGVSIPFAQASQELFAGQPALGDFTGAPIGVTVADLVLVKTAFMARNVDVDSDPLHCAADAAFFGDLLNQTSVTSSDFNTVKALVNGEINQFMGITFHHTQLTPFSDGHDDSVPTDRRVMFWAQSGLMLGVGEDPMTRIEERADKAFSTYVFMRMTLGAIRLEEEKVIRLTYNPLV
jgi:hypothetical protein